ncbi:hypothetical protein ACWDRZ_24185 [Streptomyces sp. NPDC003509]
MTQQPEVSSQPFTLHLDASDGTCVAGVGVVWSDGAATLHRPQWPGSTPVAAPNLDALLTFVCGRDRHLYRVEKHPAS